MTRGMAMLVAVALLCAARAVVGAPASDIYTWTDADGVVHFSDAPPSPTDTTAATPGDDLLPLDEDTPVPATLNDLAPADSSPASAIVRPGEHDSTAAIPTDSGNLSFGAIGPGTMTPEELDALDPVWFRGGEADPGDPAAVYFDANGPFSIGEPLEDTRVPPEVRCRAARRDLAILLESWPVYRDQGGRLRYQWARDPYRGPRRYLDDAGRSSALAGVRQTLQRDCPRADDPGAQADARRQLLRAALCEAEQAELAALESLGSDAPGPALDAKRTLAAEVCGEPLADAQVGEAATATGSGPPAASDPAAP